MSLDTDDQLLIMQQLFQNAIHHHQNGNLQEAEKLYGEILLRNPEQPQVLNMFGVLAAQTLRHELAASLFRKAIAIQPEGSEYYNNLALVLVDVGKYEEAGKYFCKALELNHDFCDAHFNYGNLLLKSCQYLPAIEHYMQALLIRPSSADVYINLGQALYKLRKYDQAEEAYKKALEYQPDLALACCNLGQLYLALGRYEDAIYSYEEAIRISPDYVKPYASLAFTKKCNSKDDDLIAGIKYFLDQEHCNTENTIQLLFSLGKLYDDCNEYDLAFSYFKKANDLKSHMMNFNPLKFQREIDSIISIFSKDFIEKRRQFGNHSTRPVFIIGMPRSGTSLVEQIIASHPMAEGLGELTFFSEQMGVIKDQLLQHIEYWSRADRQCFDEVAGKYLELLSGYVSNDIQRVVDKMPYNYLHLGLIYILFPHAHIIHCKRDPVDTCFSIYCNDFEGRHEYTNLLSDLGFYYAQYRRLMDHWYNTFPGSIMDVEYEYLVSNQELASKEIMKFIGLPWDEACLEFYRNSRAVNTRSAVQVRQPIYKSSIRRWKNYEKYLGLLIKSLGDHTG
jgi:tetratricopeptide (TPR) repeat protein